MDIVRIAANKYLEAHPEDAARLLEELPIEETTSLLESTPPPLAARALQWMDNQTAAGCLDLMKPESGGAVLERLPIEVAALLLRRLADPKRAAILEKAPSEAGERLRRVLQYPEGTAGALMDAGVLILLEGLTAREALHEVREHANQLSRYLYVVSRDKRLVGVVTLRELFLAPPDTPVRSIMHTDVQKVPAYTGFQAVLVHPGWLAHYALPVVEDDDLFVGALRFKTLRRLEQEYHARRQDHDIGAAGLALGELYQIGLSGLIRGAISLSGPENDT